MQITRHRQAGRELRADLLAVPLGLRRSRSAGALPPRLAALDRALGGRLGEVVQRGDFRGKRGETLLLWAGAGARRPACCWSGSATRRSSTPRARARPRRSAVAAAPARGAARWRSLAPASRRLRVPALVQALAEGAVLAGYRFDRYRSASEDARRRGRRVQRRDRARRGPARRARRGRARRRRSPNRQNVARDLSNEPPNALPPARPGARRERSREARSGCAAACSTSPELRRRKMGALLAVGGRQREPAAADRARARRAAPRRGGRRRAAGLPGRQGHHLRLGRPLDQADRRAWSR